LILYRKSAGVFIDLITEQFFHGGFSLSLCDSAPLRWKQEAELSIYPLTPALRKNVIMGHQLVKADWNKFKPTKIVNRYQ